MATHSPYSKPRRTTARPRRLALIGRSLAHYRITAAIGAGGMGEVYRATDSKLGREVALKVLPPDMARDPERLARFQREARAVAALNHPHIVTIFSVEESGGAHFLTMELVEGQSLDHRTDIFSLGIILYEMSTGHRPFMGASSAELASAILRDTPPLVTDVRANLPADLAGIIRRCLEKNGPDRFQSARDIRNALRGVNTVDPGDKPTIVDVVPRIVSTIADWYGVLRHTMCEVLRSKDVDQLSPYEAVLRSFGYYERLSTKEHAIARICLERAVEQAPDNADCWAMLSMIYSEEYKFGFNALPDPLGRALQAARRAAEAAPANSFAHFAVATALFFRKEFQAFRIAAERAIAPNPMDGFTLAYMGMLLAFSGDWTQGCALTERALELNPRHPGWYRFTAYYDAYRRRDYRAALRVALRINMPGFHATHHVLAAAYAQLGELDAAAQALRELLAVSPNFAVFAREEFGKWLEPGLVEHVVDGLRKAGLEIPAKK